MKHKSLLQTIGNTPLVQLPFPGTATVLAKLEYLNPGGSVKDRSALFMIEQAEKQGLLKPGGTIIEASSGNQGIATAMIGAIKGYKVIITTNDKFSKDKINAIKAYGAKIIMCPATAFIENPNSYHSVALKLSQEIPNSFMLNQYYSLANPQAHYTWLAQEIWQQTDGQLTHFFAATGSCGTITGCGRFFKEKNKAIKIIGVDACNSYRSTQGNPKPYALEGLGVDFDGPIFQESLRVVDDFYTVGDQQGIAMLKKLAWHYGLLVGPSTGAVAYAVEQSMKHLPENAVVVMICADSGRAYLNKEYYTACDDYVSPKNSNPECQII